MEKRKWKLVSIAMVVVMLVSLLPSGIMTFAEGEGDNTLLSLSYTYCGSTEPVTLVADDLNGALQENRYSVTLPYITKTFTTDRLPTVTALPATSGASVVVTQAATFPGTAKILVTSVNGEKRTYYVRFKYASGNVTNVVQKIASSATKVYPAYNDLQPMSLTDLRALYLDVNTQWETYCRALVDRGLSGTSAIADDPVNASSSKIPSSIAPLLDGKTGLYIQDYQTYTPVATTSNPTPTPRPWANMWLATGVSSNGGATVLNSSPYFEGATWVAAGNDDKATTYMKEVHDDAITFNIDRGATVWVAMNNSTDFANFATYGWSRDTSLTKKLYHGDGSAYGYFYYKHFSAGETVKIPTYGQSTSLPGRMYMPFVLWDAPGTGDTTLASLSATVNGTPVNIAIVPTQTTYKVSLPAGGIPVLSATPKNATAEIDIIQATAFPGSATVNVLSGPNAATYTINFTIEGQDDAALSALSYTPVGGSSTAITIGSEPYTYNIDLPNTTLPNQIPTVDYTLHSPGATAVVTNPSALPGTTTILVTAQDGVTKNTYTINWAVPGLASATVYAAPQTPDLGKSGMTMTYPYGSSYPVLPANYSGNLGALTNADVARNVTNYGNISTYTARYDRNGTAGSVSYVYTKFDLSAIDTNIVKAILKLDARVSTGNTAYGLINTFPAVVNIIQVPETGWLTGTGTGDAFFDATTGNLTKTGWLTNQTDINGPLSAKTAPDAALALADASVTDKTVQRVASFTIPAGAHNAYNNYDVDVTSYLAARKAAGFSTATLRLQVAPCIYGPETYNGKDATTVTASFTREGTSGARVELITSATAGTMLSDNNKLEYITLGSGNSANIARTLSFEKNTANQSFDILTSDLISGKVSLNAIASDASADISINGSVVSAGSCTALITPVQGVATAQVAVTAPNGDVFTYNLTFHITDYVISTDSSLKTITYTHTMLGTKAMATTAGVTTYEATLPYGISEEIPVVAAVTNHSYAVVESVTQATTIPGSASVVVKAEDGSKSTYTIHFTKASTPPVVDHLPGTVTNVLNRYSNATTAKEVPTANTNYRPVQGSKVVPYAKYTLSTPENPTPYLTTADIAAATMSDNNPYYTDDETTWMYGDRAVKPDTSSGTLANPWRNNSQYVTVEGTSPLFVGDDVTKVLVSNTEKDFTLSIPDLYTFDINKAATIYVSSYTSTMHANYVANGWNKETGLKIYKSTNTYPPMDGLDGYYYAVPNGATALTAVYSKHYLEGATVSIPSRGVISSNGLIIYVVWDECNSLATLSDIKVDGTSITGFAADTSAYDIVLPAGTTAVPTLTATPSFSGAGVVVTNPETLPGSATISVAAADGVTTGSYTIHYTVESSVPSAPTVTVNDIANTIVGLDLATMEYAIFKDSDGTYGLYTSDPLPVLTGSKVVKVRVKAQGEIPASADTILTFTPDAGDVSGDGVIDISDVIMAAEIAVGVDTYTAAQIARANVSDKLVSTVDISDVVMIAERAVGATTIFPVDLP